MWYRLKSSLLSAAVATLLVLGFLAVAQPDEPPAPRGPLLGLSGLDADQERVAFQLAVALTALAIDSAIESRERKESTRARGTDTRRDRSTSSIRMPFYSFAAKPARNSES